MRSKEVIIVSLIAIALVAYTLFTGFFTELLPSIFLAVAALILFTTLSSTASNTHRNFGLLGSFIIFAHEIFGIFLFSLGNGDTSFIYPSLHAFLYSAGFLLIVASFTKGGLDK